MTNDETPVFSVHGPRIRVRRPRTVVAAMVISLLACVEIDSSTMSQEFLMKLMYHVGQGNLRVKVSEVVQ